MKQSKNITRTLLTGLVGLSLLGGLVAGCQLFDNNSSSLTAPTAETVRPENFIIGSTESTNWGGQYAEDNTYFMVNIPIVGAVKVEYTITGGATFALFVETKTPTKWEIGLKTVDGVTDTLQNVCVTYTEGVPFANVPADATTSTQHQATHYLRTLENGTENWWPSDAAFGFAGETTTVCVVVDGKVQGEEVAGPFPKTPASSNAAPVATVSGATICGLGSCFGIYTYTDAEGDPEGTSLYQWYVADDASGTNAAVVTGATTPNLLGTDPFKYYQFRVTPVAVSGTSPGSTASSAWLAS